LQQPGTDFVRRAFIQQTGVYADGAGTESTGGRTAVTECARNAIRSPRWSIARMAGGEVASALAHAIDMNRLIPAKNRGNFKIRFGAIQVNFRKLAATAVFPPKLK